MTMNTHSIASVRAQTRPVNARKKRRVDWSMAATLCLTIFFGGSLYGADEVLKKAMRDELTRSVDQLQFEQFGKPYFVAFRVSDVESIIASATFGSLVNRSKTRARSFSVEIRVGNRSLDNTNFAAMPGAGAMRYFGMTQLPLDDDYTELRRQMWLTTDVAYKQAAETLARKRGVLEGKILGEPVDDFSQEEPAVIADEIAAPPLDRNQAEALAVRLSEEFKKFPDIFDSQVVFSSQTQRVHYLNSEGASYLRSYPAARLVATAATQAQDGSQLADFEAFYGRSPANLPDETQIAAAVRDLADRLTSLRKASTLDLYNGPVLFEDAAAAEITNQVLVPQLLAIRRPVVENPQMERMFGEVETFADRIGARVLPRFLTVLDNPLLEEIQGTRLAGSYKVDDEGVPARETTVISQGILKTLLAGRTPVRGISKSTGNRRGSGPAPSNLVFNVSDGQTREALRKELLNAAKERGLDYGIVIRRVQNREVLQRYQRDLSRLVVQQGGREGGRIYPTLAAVRLYADGREELIRNLEIANMTGASFRDILAASLDRTVYTIPFMARIPRLPGMAMTGDSPVCSLVVPSLLFEEVTLRKPAAEQPKLPVSSHPYFAK